jgi:hypothetical protein
MGGSNHHNWQGGIASLNTFLRDAIKQWKFDSLKEYKFKCAVTGCNSSIEVHHLHSFTQIVKEFLLLCDLELRHSYNMYSLEERTLLSTTCANLHYKYGLGIPLMKTLHSKFHSIYGYSLVDSGEFALFVKNEVQFC